jgi:hypothetical protein
MRIPIQRVAEQVRDLLAGRLTIAPHDLLPRKLPSLRKTLAPPAIPPPHARHLSRHLLSLGHDPAKFNLPVPPADAARIRAATNYEIPYVSPAARRVEREAGRRAAKIEFVRAQMRKMPEIVEKWREERRRAKKAKEKRYPY